MTEFQAVVRPIIGPLIEVPVMIGLVDVSRWARRAVVHASAMAFDNGQIMEPGRFM